MLRASILSALVLLGGALVALAQVYEIQQGDQLEISVLEDPALNRQVLVRPDGNISFPLAGTVKAEGRSPEALQTAIRSRLAGSFVEPPTVTVSLIAVSESAPEEGGISVYVIGEVGQAGRYEVEAPVDALQALAIAGGPGVFAARDRIQIRRVVGDSPTVILFDYERVEDGAVPIDTVLLRDGDVIVVPERGLFD